MKVELATAPAIAPPPRERAARTSDTFSAAFADARESRDARDTREATVRASRDDARETEERERARRTAAHDDAAMAPPPAPPARVERAPAEHDPRVDGPRVDAARAGDKPADDTRVEAKPADKPADKAGKSTDRAPRATDDAASSDDAQTCASSDESLTITVTVPGTPDAEIINVPSIQTIRVPIIEPDADADAVAVPVTESVPVAVTVAGSVSVPVTDSDSGSDSDSDAASGDRIAGADRLANLAPHAPAEAFALPVTHHVRAADAAVAPDSLATQLRDQLQAEPTGSPATAGIAHARLVLGDDDRRVVVSVALRHGTVDVAIRADDPSLAHAVARSHGDLEHALRGHGLALGDLTSRDGHPGARDQRADTAAAPRTSAAARFFRSDEPTASAPTTSYPTDPHLRALA